VIKEEVLKRSASASDFGCTPDNGWDISREPSMTTRRQVLTTLAGASALAAGFPRYSSAAEKPVRLGFSIAKTGMFAAAAESQVQTYNFWKDQVNAAGGLDVAGTKRPVEFVSYDDQGNPAQTAKFYEKLITEDKVDLLLAPWGTSTHIGVAPVVERYKFPLVGNSAASTELRNLKPGYIWFVTADFPDRVAKQLPLLLKASGIKSVALISNVLDFTKEVKGFLEPALKEQGIEIRVNEEYPPSMTDMTAVLSKVKQAAPDGVMALAYPPDSVLYTRTAKEIGIAAPFQFCLVGPGSDFFHKVLGSAAEGIVTMGQWSPKRNPAAEQFNKDYIAAVKEMPDYLDSIEAYDSLQVLTAAVKVAGLDKAKLRDAIAKGRFDTIIGPIQFTGVENLVTPAGFLQVQNGVPQQIWPSQDAVAQLQPKKGY
jgi:branched-chain amino acid transport system substrate-binding protein